MHSYRNLSIIGSSHISIESVEEVKKEFENAPDIVALELDIKRVHGILNKGAKSDKKYILKKLGLKVFLFAVIAEYVQKKLGEIVNIDPGEEMRTALVLARKNNLKVALIDQDIELTLRKLTKRISFKEKMNFIGDIFSGFFSKKKMIKFDLTKVPPKHVIREMVSHLKKRYPNVYSVLIDERNHIMAGKLSHIMANEPDKKILCVVGAGHVDDIINILQKKDAELSKA
ncbi:MAG: TraB/GumN family protein [Nanoarchaeota archaeon]|nr:TraB/GumN family protein [Nanoarchaeota archaeon]